MAHPATAAPRLPGADRCDAGLALAGDSAPPGPPWQDAPHLPPLVTRRHLARLPAPCMLQPV